MTRATTTLHTLPTRGPFSLRRTALVGFGHRAERDWDDVMRLAFTVDGTHEESAGVAVRQDGERLRLSITSTADPDRVAAQVARVLSVHVDGRPFAALAERDRAVAALHRAAGGLRPPQFYSPYEAAAWSILSARRSAAQGRVLRARISERFGTAYELAGRIERAFPIPQRLLEVDHVPGLPAAAIPRLHAVAAAALRGELAADRLFALEPEAARQDVQRLPGIGPFYSGLIVYRALGLPDVLPLIEPRSRAALERLHGIDAPLDDASFLALAERWRPYRMWMVFLARAVGDRAEPVAVARA